MARRCLQVVGMIMIGWMGMMVWSIPKAKIWPLRREGTKRRISSLKISQKPDFSN
jgi:hypothetical protein